MAQRNSRRPARATPDQPPLSAAERLLAATTQRGATVELSLEANAEVVTIRVGGDLLAAGCGALRETVLECTARQPRTVVIDMTDVPFIDTSGLGVLVGLRATLRGRGIAFSLANPGERVGTILRQTRLDAVFGIGHS